MQSRALNVSWKIQKTFIKSHSYDSDWIYGKLWLLVLIFTITEEISKEA